MTDRKVPQVKSAGNNPRFGKIIGFVLIQKNPLQSVTSASSALPLKVTFPTYGGKNVGVGLPDNITKNSPVDRAKHLVAGRIVSSGGPPRGIPFCE
jgi:hypothetical protein